MQYPSIFIAVITIVFVSLSLMGCQKQDIEDLMPLSDNSTVMEEPMPLSTYFDGIYVGNTTEISLDHKTVYDSVGNIIDMISELDTMVTLNDTVFVRENEDQSTFQLEGPGAANSFSFWDALSWESDSTAMASYEVQGWTININLKADRDGSIEIQSYERWQSSYAPSRWKKILFSGRKLTQRASEAYQMKTP